LSIYIVRSIILFVVIYFCFLLVFLSFLFLYLVSFDVYFRIFFMKKIFLLSGLGFFLSPSLMAEGMPFSGVSIGANLGGSFAGVFEDSFFTNIDLAAENNLSKGTAQGSGLGGGLFLGAGHTFQNGFHFSVALEGGLSGLKGSFKEERSAFDRNLKFKKSHSFGLNLKPGIVVGQETPFLIHLTCGIEYAQWKIHDSFEHKTFNSNKRLTGWNAGVGMAGMVSKGMSVGLNVTRTFYKKQSFKGTLPVMNGYPLGARLNNKIEPTETRVMASITKYL
jgi:opacity protein-like surface antigen